MSPDIVAALRSLEDGLLVVALAAGLAGLVHTGRRLRGGPFQRVPLAMAPALLPFLGWKLVGDAGLASLMPADLLPFWAEVGSGSAGEAFEAIGGVALALGLFVVLRVLNRAQPEDEELDSLS